MVLGKEHRGLHLVSLVPLPTRSIQQSQFGTSCLSVSELWHCRLRHPSSQHMGHIKNLPCKGPTTSCSICPQAKQLRSSFLLSTSRANKAFELLHVDIWDPYRTATYDSYKLFLSIVDDYSRAT